MLKRAATCCTSCPVWGSVTAITWAEKPWMWLWSSWSVTVTSSVQLMPITLLCKNRDRTVQGNTHPKFLLCLNSEHLGLVFLNVPGWVLKALCGNLLLKTISYTLLTDSLIIICSQMKTQFYTLESLYILFLHSDFLIRKMYKRCCSIMIDFYFLTHLVQWSHKLHSHTSTKQDFA